MQELFNNTIRTHHCVGTEIATIVAAILEALHKLEDSD